MVEHSIRSRTPPATSTKSREKGDSRCTMCTKAHAEMMIHPGYACTNGAKSACSCTDGTSYGVCEECWMRYAEASLEEGVRRMACGDSDACAAACPICKTPNVCIFRIVKIPPPPRVRHRAIAQSLPAVPPPPPPASLQPASHPTGALVASEPAFEFPELEKAGGFDLLNLLHSDAADAVVPTLEPGSSFVDEQTGEVMHIVNHDSLTDLVSQQDMAARARTVLASFRSLDESISRYQKESEERTRTSARLVAEILVAIQEPKRTPSGRRAPSCSHCHAQGHYRKTCPALA